MAGHTLKELKGMSISELKKVAKSAGLSDIGSYKKEDKGELAKAVSKILKACGSSRRNSSKKRSRRKRSSRKKSSRRRSKKRSSRKKPSRRRSKKRSSRKKSSRRRSSKKSVRRSAKKSPSPSKSGSPSGKYTTKGLREVSTMTALQKIAVGLGVPKPKSYKKDAKDDLIKEIMKYQKKGKVSPSRSRSSSPVKSSSGIPDPLPTTLSGFKKLTVPVLKKIAASQGIPIAAKAKKDDVIAGIMGGRSDDDDDEPIVKVAVEVEDDEDDDDDEPIVKTQKKVEVEEDSENEYEPRSCQGGSEDDLKKMSPTQLKAILTEAGVTKGVPVTKAGKIEYLCALKNNGTRCDPENRVWCDGDLVCDSSNSPGVCLSPDVATAHGSNLTSWEYEGKTILGTSKAITALKKNLGAKNTGVDKKLPVSDKAFSVAQYLKKIQDGNPAEIGDMAEAMTEVFKCLGLPADQ